MSTFTDRHRSDFNFDGTGDILWRDHAGDNVLWLMIPPGALPATQASLPFVSPDWHVKATADFDGSGSPSVVSADILWQNDNGALVLWQMNGTSVTASTALALNPGPAWHVVGDNDFNGDFADDILFRNDNGALAIWTIHGAATGTITGTFASTVNPGTDWHVVGTGDTNIDGTVSDSKAGIVWQHDSGALVLWEDPVFAAGTFTFSTVAALPTVGAGWHAKGMADFNGDGRADIVLQHDSGSVVVWEMGGASGTTVTAVNLVNLNPGPTWHVAGLRDMSNDGHAGILFQNDNGVAATWEDYHSLGGGLATFDRVLAIDPNPNPNGHVWDLL